MVLHTLHDLPAWRRTAHLFAAMVAMTACIGVDSDDPSGSGRHRCVVSYDDNWPSVIDMHFEHDDPRWCPIPIASLADNEVDFSGQGVDTDADDAMGTAVLEITNSAGQIVGGDLADWQHDQFGDLVAEVSDTYLAATGVTSQTEDPDDQATVVVQLQQQPSAPAEAYVDLEVLFGVRSTTLSGPASVPVASSCQFSAASFLSGQPRPNMLHKWHVNGSYQADGDTYQIPPTYTHVPGQVDLTVRSIDEHGHSNWGGQTVQVSDETYSCS
jgi:hypothetical protein